MNNRATILILTLWILTFLSAIALSITYRMRIELKIIKTELARAESLYVAEAGVMQAINVLNQDDNEYDALSDKWSNYTGQLYGIDPFREISVGKGRFNVSYIYERDIFTGYEQVFYGMHDEERKINVNKATQYMLESLPGITFEVATSICAWRGDEELTEDILLKEDVYYKGLEKPYERKGKEIEHIEELLLIRGVTQELLFGKDLDGNGIIDFNEQGTAQYLTVYGDEKGKVNINTASVIVLRALGFGEDLSYKILRYRLGGDEALGTDDDEIFTDVGKISDNLIYIGELLTQDEVKLLTEKKDLLKVTSRYYTADIEGKIQGKCKCNIQVTIDKDAEEGVQVVRWIEE